MLEVVDDLQPSAATTHWVRYETVTVDTGRQSREVWVFLYLPVENVLRCVTAWAQVKTVEGDWTRGDRLVAGRVCPRLVAEQALQQFRARVTVDPERTGVN